MELCKLVNAVYEMAPQVAKVVYETSDRGTNVSILGRVLFAGMLTTFTPVSPFIAAAVTVGLFQTTADYVSSVWSSFQKTYKI